MPAYDKPLTKQQWDTTSEGWQRQLLTESLDTQKGYLKATIGGNHGPEYIAQCHKWIDDAKSLLPRHYNQYVKDYKAGEQKAKETTWEYWANLDGDLNEQIRKVAGHILSMTSASPMLKIEEYRAFRKVVNLELKFFKDMKEEPYLARFV